MSQVTISGLPANIGLVGSELLEISNSGISESVSVLGFAAVYQQISEKNAANGYAGLDGSSQLLLTAFPTGTALQLLRRNAANTALEFVDQPPNSDTPWTVDHDAAAFNLTNLGFINFGAVSADTGNIRLPNLGTIEWESFPLGVNGSITYTATEAIEIFAGNTTAFSIQPTLFQPNRIVSIGTFPITFEVSTQSIQSGGTLDIQYDVPATGSHLFRVNDVVEYSYNSTEADFNQNNITDVGFMDFGTGSANAGTIRLPNQATIEWEASPAGNNGTISFSTAEQLLLDNGSGVDLVISSTSFSPNRQIDLTGTLSINFNNGADGSIKALSGVLYDVNGVTKTHQFTVNDINEFTIKSAEIDFHGNNLVNVGPIEINNPADTFQYIITSDAIVADRILNLPLMDGTDTLVLNDFAATLTNKTLGTGTVFSVIPTINDGITFTFNPNATVSGVNMGAHTANPSSLVDGDVWYNSTTNTLFGRINSVNIDLGAAGASTPPFADTTSLVEGSVDPTKEIRFEVDGLTTATIRVITPPDADITLVNTSDGLIADAQTATFTTTKISTTNKALLNSAIVYNDQTNTFGNFAQIFRDDQLFIQNPAETAEYQINASGITLDRTITLPLLLANDIFVFENFAQTLTNKTLTAPIFVDLGFIADANSNEMLIFNTIASAVNEFTIANAVTGTGPILSVTGGNTDIDLNIDAKGTGIISLNSDTKVTGQFNLDVAGLLTIATAAITVTKSFHRIEGEGAAADTLSTINGGVEGDVLVLRSNTTANDITIDEAGNIILNTAGSFILTDVQDTIVFIFDGSNWLEISRSDNTV